MLIGLNHVGIVVPRWEDARRFYVDALGLTVDRVYTPTDEGLYMAPERLRIFFVRAGQSPVPLEVLVPQDATSGTAKLLSKRGPGLHHISFTSDDIPGDARRLRDQGLQQIDLSRGKGDMHAGTRSAFFHPKSCLGILTELSPASR